MCNHWIENDAAFGELFSQYQDFLLLGKLESLPDLRTFKKKIPQELFRLD
jgi:hypothetical protein